MTAKRTVKHITVSEMGNNPQLAKLLQHNRWFGELPQDVLDELLALARIRTLQDGEFVYAKDDQPDGLYGVISGSTRISNIGQDGREAILAILSPGSWFGEISLFDGLPRREMVPGPFTDGRLTIEEALFADRALVFPNGSDALRYGPETGAGLSFTFRNLPDLALWKPIGAPFLCVEPWHGTASVEGDGPQIADRPNSIILAPGASAEFGYAVTLEA